MLPQVRVWTDARRRALQARWRESRERQDVGWWRDFFGYVAQSSFLTGRGHGGNGRSWQCDLEWLINPGNMAKVIEGRYEDATA